jgi:hypothetical protein
MKFSFCLDEIPEETAVHQFLMENTDLEEQARNLKKNAAHFVKVRHNFPTDELVKEVQQLLASHLFQAHHLKGVTAPKPTYFSIPVTIDPKSQDAPIGALDSTGLGSNRFSGGSFADYKPSDMLRNTYNDPYSMLAISPRFASGHFGSSLALVRRTLIRSRLSMTEMNQSLAPTAGWHNDEPIFLNFRLNIPLITNSNNVVQLLEVGRATKVIEIPLTTGTAVGYDSHRIHRAFTKHSDSSQRINLILGISPWFDFNPTERTWSTNEFYGRMHPFEMLLGGHIIPLCV